MFDHCLYFNTTSLARLLEREWSKAFQPFGLTPPQAFMLRVILEKPGSLQRELAQLMTISRPTATRTLDGLQRLDMIERRDSKHDGREWEVHPTPQAIALKDQLNAASAEVTRLMKKRLGTTEFADSVGKMKAVRKALE